jgi:hypothetical protein
MSDPLTPVYVTFGGSKMRRKVFVREELSLAAGDAASSLYDQGVIEDGDFPVVIAIYRNHEDAEPIGRRTVDMDIRPIFQVYEIEDQK